MLTLGVVGHLIEARPPWKHIISNPDKLKSADHNFLIGMVER